MGCCARKRRDSTGMEDGAAANRSVSCRRWYRSTKNLRLLVMLAMTFGYFLVEIIFGYITNSMSLVADSFHMLSDVLALLIAMACMAISKTRSQKNTFGWVRAEILGALVNAVFLLALCFSIFVEAVKRLLEPELIEDPQKILIVGSIGLLVNIVGILMFHSHASMGGHGHSHGGGRQSSDNRDDNDELHKLADAHNVALVLNSFDSQSVEEDTAPLAIAEDQQFVVSNGGTDGNDNEKISDVISPSVPSSGNNNDKPTVAKKKSGGASQMNMHGVFLHILGDAFGSVIVIINAIVCWKTDSEMLKKYLDPSLSLIMVLIIMTTTTPLLKESALILLQTAPKSINVSELKQRLLKFDGVLAVHEFHVWRLAGEKIIATLHIRFRSLNHYLAAVEKIKSFFHDHDIHSTTIQPEFAEMGGLEEESAYGGSGECFIRCPTEECDTVATCCAKGGAAVGKTTGGTRRSLPDIQDATGDVATAGNANAAPSKSVLQSSQSAALLMGGGGQQRLLTTEVDYNEPLISTKVQESLAPPITVANDDESSSTTVSPDASKAD